MAGRFPGALPRFTGRQWSLELARDLDELMKRLFDSVSVMNRVPQDPTMIQAGDAADPGTTSGITAPALEDHVHPVDISGTPGVIGDTSVQGVGTGLAATDHTHRMGIVSVKGDILSSNGTNPVAVAIGSDGLVATADTASASGWKWATTGVEDAEMLGWISLMRGGA
jgi:hypothetical protein